MEVYMGWSGVDCSVCQPLKWILSRCQDFPSPQLRKNLKSCQHFHSPLSLHSRDLKWAPNCHSRSVPSTPFVSFTSFSHWCNVSVEHLDNAPLALHNFCVIDVDDDDFSLCCNSQHVLASKWSRGTLKKKSFALLDFSSNWGKEWVGEETEIKSFMASPSSRHFAFSSEGESFRIVTESAVAEWDGYRWIFQTTDSENIMMSVEIPSQAMSSSSFLSLLLLHTHRFPSEGKENHLFSPILRDDLKFYRDSLIPGHPAAWLSSSLNNLFNYWIPSPWKAFLKLARRRRLWIMVNFKSWRETY